MARESERQSNVSAAYESRNPAVVLSHRATRGCAVKFLEGIMWDMVDWISHFLGHTLVPWAWEHKLWFVVLIPFAAIITIAKWIRG